ncbi:MAG: hypothetical protein RL394_1409, partial [Bacteroidota bacterium]
SFSNSKTANPILQFAIEELKFHLGSKAIQENQTRFHFSFNKNSALKNGAFSYAIQHASKKINVVFSGEDETAIVHAVHGFLEHLGFQFEFNGTIPPSSIQADTLRNGNYTTVPFARWRGIRQHVNFPMDISSYPIEEAKTYLKNMIRMRFNKLAVHSYPNLWHEVHTGDSIEYAGNFFYNRPHEIPSIPLIKNNIRFNEKYFVIPAIEPYYGDRIRKSAMAVDWMKELLSYAKSIGLRIQFSVEPRTRGDVNYILDNCRSAMQNYPMIDELEVITEELGGWGNACTDTAVRKALVSHFGKAVLEDTLVTNVIRKNQTDLDNLVHQVGRNIEAVRIINKDPLFASGKISLKLGVYCTIQPYAAMAYHMVRKYMPSTELTIMPGHGSVRTANNFAKVQATATDLAKTTVFSWLEFDGLMFTQQNPIAGIESLVNDLRNRNKGQQVNAIIFNHWRTAENRTAAKYAALTSMLGPIEKNDFYASYAKKLGIAETNMFVDNMNKLEKIDLLSTNDLPNVGFCWIGAWLQGAPYTWMNRTMLQKVNNMYDSVGSSLEEIKKSVINPEGQSYLNFLCNRIGTSSLYLKAFSAGAAIQTIEKDGSGKYSGSAPARATSICNEALLLFEKYMEMHTKMMPDRGTEGTLINLWHGPMYALKVLRKTIGNIPMDAPIKEEKSSDAPPLPILIKKG